MRSLVIALVIALVAIHLFTREGLRGLVFEPELIVARTVGAFGAASEAVEEAVDETADAIEDPEPSEPAPATPPSASAR